METYPAVATSTGPLRTEAPARQVGRGRARRRAGLALLTPLLLGTLITGAGPATAVGTMESMPLWRLQVRITTGSRASDGTDGHPALRLNQTATGVRTLYPRSTAAFDPGRVDMYDLRLLASPSQMTMLRLGIAGSDGWCVRKVEVFFNGRLAFDRDIAPRKCLVVAGRYIEFSSAELRHDDRWTAYGSPPPLPKHVGPYSLAAAVEGATGSAMLSSPGYSWDRTVPLGIVRRTSTSIRVSFGVVVKRSGDSFEASVTYDVRLVVGGDGRLHAAKANASCRPQCDDARMGDAVVGHLDTALSRMTTRASPHDPLRFVIDALSGTPAPNIRWSYVPVIR